MSSPFSRLTIVVFPALSRPLPPGQAPSVSRPRRPRAGGGRAGGLRRREAARRGFAGGVRRRDPGPGPGAPSPPSGPGGGPAAIRRSTPAAPAGPEPGGGGGGGRGGVGGAGEAPPPTHTMRSRISRSLAFTFLMIVSRPIPPPPARRRRRRRREGGSLGSGKEEEEGCWRCLPFACASSSCRPTSGGSRVSHCSPHPKPSADLEIARPLSRIGARPASSATNHTAGRRSPGPRGAPEVQWVGGIPHQDFGGFVPTSSPSSHREPRPRTRRGVPAALRRGAMEPEEDGRW